MTGHDLPPLYLENLGPRDAESGRRNLWRFEKRCGIMLRFRLWQELSGLNIWVPTTLRYEISAARFWR